MTMQQLQGLKGVGPKLCDKLARLGIVDLDTLLFHLPSRYLDRTRITPMGSLRPEQEVVLEGQVQLADVVFGKRRSLLCRISDGSGSVSLRFYHFSAAQQHHLTPGRAIRVYGEVRKGAAGLELYHPEYQLGQPSLPPLEATLTPVYPTTEGISQRLLRGLIAQALALADQQPPAELLPQTNSRYSLLEALHLLHAPRADTPPELLSSGRHPAMQRLIIEELAAHQLAMLQQRQRQRAHAAPRCEKKQWAERLAASLPFPLTGAQQRVIAEILADLAADKPMLRLLQGDVGAGKTLVAAAAALSAIESGYQVAIMAPTELLARQHLASFSHWLEPFGLTPGWLAGSATAKQKREQLAALATGEQQLVIGTHALFQKEVAFQRLGLVIIDEQHRFGVQQRLDLLAKAPDDMRPHQLTMTATPIPRTLTMSLYGDLDTSLLDELPPGRQPVTTRVLPASRHDELVARLGQIFSSGQQAYWVCTLIEESEELQAQAAEVRFEELVETLPNIRIGLIHGRLSSAEKTERMQEFKQGKTQLLVATTVIEVGVDVPNAGCMVIENAERLGLSQLHQLRGRVGRGTDKSVCLLLYQPPLGQQAKARLTAMRDSNDGFLLAEEDLRLRGPGEWLGTRQAGELVFRVADLARDESLLEQAKQLASQLPQQSPQLITPLLARWLKGGEGYASV